MNNKFSSGWAWHIGICVVLALFGLYVYKNGGDFYISGAISDIIIANVIGTICSTSLLLVIVEIRLSQPKKSASLSFQDILIVYGLSLLFGTLTGVYILLYTLFKLLFR